MQIPEGFYRRPGLLAFHEVSADGLTWLAVHGNIQLAVRHPTNIGPSTEMVEKFLSRLEQQLVAWGVLTAIELEVIRQEQREALEQAHPSRPANP